MSNVALARRVDDQTGGGFRPAPVVVSALVGVVAPFFVPMPNGFVFSLVGLIAFGFLWRGVRTVMQTSDPTLAVRVFGRPMWLKIVCWIVLAVCIFANVGTFLGYGYNPPTIPGTIFWAAVGGIAYLAFTRKPGGKAEPGTDWGRIFETSGLIHRSSETGLSIYPSVIGSGRDEIGNDFVDVRMIGGHQTHDNYVNNAHRVATALGVPRVQVEKIGPVDVRLTAVVNEFERENAVAWTPADATLPVAEYLAKLPMGEMADSNTVWYQNLVETNLTVGGTPGAGKSVYLSGLLAHLSAHPHIDIAMLDLKRGAEAEPWRERLSAVHIDNASSLEFAKQSLAECEARYDRMVKARVRNAWKGFLGEDEHVKVLIIDEAGRLFKQGGNSEDNRMVAELEKVLTDFTAIGRAAGYLIIVATQKPTAVTLPPSIRDLTTTKVAFKCTKIAQAQAILGDEWSADPAIPSPVSILKRQKGRAVVSDDDGEFITVQTSYISDEEIEKIVSETAHYRAPWGVVDVPESMSDGGDYVSDDELFEDDDPEPEPEPEPLWRQAERQAEPEPTPEPEPKPKLRTL